MMLVANKVFKFPLMGGPMLRIGDRFEAREREARILLATGMAVAAPPERTKRKYQRRDMEAIGDGDD